MRGRGLRASAAAFALLALAACAPRAFRLPPEPEPELRRLTVKDSSTGNIVRAWTVLVLPDGRQLKHGPDQRWYPSGARLSEGRFEHDEPVGELVRWYESGQLKSTLSYGPEGEPTPMRFWHANGRPSGAGPAIRGRRQGLWTFWYEDGALRERGGYVDGEREGVWSFHHPDGSLADRGRYEGGERIGAWQHFEPGERPAAPRAVPPGEGADGAPPQ